jgi:hypothetical protein
MGLAPYLESDQRESGVTAFSALREACFLVTRTYTSKTWAWANLM